MELSFQKERDRVLNGAILYAFENCGAKEGQVLTDEHLRKVTSLLFEKIEPFLLHQLTISKKQNDI